MIKVLCVDVNRRLLILSIIVRSLSILISFGRLAVKNKLANLLQQYNINKENCSRYSHSHFS